MVVHSEKRPAYHNCIFADQPDVLDNKFLSLQISFYSRHDHHIHKIHYQNCANISTALPTAAISSERRARSRSCRARSAATIAPTHDRNRDRATEHRNTGRR